MAASGKKNMFNEATRVQMPAMVHLTRLGYTYFGKITEDMAGTVYDPDTNILINVFKEQFLRMQRICRGCLLLMKHIEGINQKAHSWLIFLMQIKMQ